MPVANQTNMAAVNGNQILIRFEQLQTRVLPEVSVPAQYSVSHWVPGAENHWLTIVKEAFGNSVAEWTPNLFLEIFL